jgi:hypothetical protein
MNRPRVRSVLLCFAVGSLAVIGAALSGVVPTEIQQPGTQPQELGLGLLDSTYCYSCHANVDPQTDPYMKWQGSMMSHSSRDPLFWAAHAVAEQDFPGGGDLCLRCHTSLGWLAGRSTPTDGSGLTQSDFDGVSCEFCHKLTNPDNSEYLGLQNEPFVANDGGVPPKGYRGSGMYVLWDQYERLGPYTDSVAPHGFLPSRLHRSSNLCGTCHDVSNPMTGDLAHNNGAQVPLAPGTFSGVPGAPVEDKAAFNNFPFQYGVVERTFSEHMSTDLFRTQVAQFNTFPAELKSGALRRAYLAAIASTPSGNYVDGATRDFTCQSCHMRPAEGKACSFGQVPSRADNPAHDLTGGNYWMPLAIQYLDAQNRLVGGGPLDPEQIAAMNAGVQRAKENLRMSAALSVEGNVLKVFNLTGHKLITGYPEGRRMWLRTRWYDDAGNLLRTDGEYGPLTVDIHGTPTQVETIRAPDDPNTRIYQTENGMTREWANQLLALGTSPALPLSFDRVTGAVDKTLGDLAAQAPGTSVPTLHFVLNNVVLHDNRIPPYRMSYDDARERNALPVPPSQFGAPGPGELFEHWDEVTLNPPPAAESAQIELLYQPTSWEYVQFLYRSNTGANAFLATVGDDILEAWLNTGMAAPEVMAQTLWGSARPHDYCVAKTNSLGCVPAIGSTGAPSATFGSGFDLIAVRLRNNKPGLLFYGTNGRASAPFQGGTLCVRPPIRRTAVQQSGGNASGDDCSGNLNFDFNALIASGADPTLFAGQWVDAQVWSRDPGFAPPNNTSLTNALEFVIR